MSSAGAYLLWNFALSRADASAVAVFANLAAGGHRAGGVVAARREADRTDIVGGALVLGGVRLASRVSAVAR